MAPSYTLHGPGGDLFPVAEAELAAAAVPLWQYTAVLLLGLKVARAFRITNAQLFEVWHFHPHVSEEWICGHHCSYAGCRKGSVGKATSAGPGRCEKTTVLVFPHPSGASHFWNNECCRRKAAKALRWFVSLAATSEASSTKSALVSTYFRKSTQHACKPAVSKIK